MKLLTRPAGAQTHQLRVISDSSMTMSFALPSSFLQARDKSLATTIQTHNPIENAAEGVDESWEERDWETEAIRTANAKSTYQSADEWEEETALDLPDDFPRLIVNLTKVQRHHFSESQEETDLDMMEVFHRIKTTLHQHFSQLAEGLFEQKLCFHCTYGTSRTMMDNLHTAYPEDTFAMVDYPTEIDHVPLHHYLHILSYPSKWKSVEYLKDCLRRSSRDMRWKKDVITELELLAEQESMQYEEKLQRLSDEIDELTRLRDSFRKKLAKLARSGSQANGQYLMLRRLEDIENRLKALLDEYLKVPELEEKECYSAFGNSKGKVGVPTGMNVLDMVIAMVFCRLPRDFSQHTTAQEHFQMLFDHHLYILRLWKNDFGRLPPRSRVASEHEDRSDSDGIQRQSEAQVVADSPDQSDIEEQTKAFSSHCRVDERGLSDDLTSVKLDDDGQSVHFKHKDIRDDQPQEGEAHDNIDLDGYGADYDSIDSEDEEPATQQVQLQQNAAKLKGSGIFKGSTRSHRRHSTRSNRRSNQLVKSEQRRSDAPFHPFACTGAVDLLRLAKENEMF